MQRPRVVLLFCFLAALRAQAPALDVGWSEEFDGSLQWQEDNSGVGALARDRGAQSEKGVARFIVRDPLREARWARATEPVWVAEYKYLLIRYRAFNLDATAGALITLRPGSVGPVTPGSQNRENPFAKGAKIDVLRADEIVGDGQWHQVAKDLSRMLLNTRADQVIVRVPSGSQGNARLELDYIRFTRHDPRKSIDDYFPVTAGTRPGNFGEIDLGPAANVAPEDAMQALDMPGNWVGASEFTWSGVPFRNGRVAATTVQGKEVISVPLDAAAREIFLLLGARVSGIQSGAVPCTPAWACGGAAFEAPDDIREPERFWVELDYENGAVDRVFPYDISAGRHHLANKTIAVYSIPAGGGKIRTMRLYDRSASAQFLLFGATLNRGEPLFPQAWTVAPSKHGEARHIVQGAPAITIAPGRLILENGYYRYEFGTANGFSLEHLLNKFAGLDMLGGPSSLFSCEVSAVVDGTPLAALFRGSDFRVAKMERSGGMVAVALDAADKHLPLHVDLMLKVSESPDIEASLTVTNPGKRAIRAGLGFPALSGLRVGTVPETRYLFPRDAAVLSSENASWHEAYSGSFPMPFVDIYNADSDAGFYILVKDLSLLPKIFDLDKRSSGISVGVSYSYPVRGPGEYRETARLEPGAVFRAAPATLGVHRGDWHAAFDEYRRWAATWYRPISPRKTWFQDVFNCRRDYPIGGSGMLFDVYENRYTPEKLIDEGSRELGGIDLIDISGWAYSPRYGRVGDYSHYELGGLEGMRDAISQAHAMRVPVDLYAEGYLVDINSVIGQEHARDWQIINRLGERQAWPGAPAEIFACPYDRSWQDYMAQTYRRVLSETGADAMYIDEYGFARPEAACYSTHHGHTPGAGPAAGEGELMRKVREAMDSANRGSALFIESIPPDMNAQYVDGALCYGLNKADERVSPGKINLFRFAFPDFKLFDMVSEGIDAKALSEADMKRSLFNGNGMWLKGHVMTWYPPEVRQFIARAHAILRKHAGTLRSPMPSPLIETEQPAILANRFSTPKEMLFTLFNDTFQTVRGPTLRLPHETAHWSCRDEWNERPLGVRRDGVISLELGPKNVGVVACSPPASATQSLLSPPARP